VSRWFHPTQGLKAYTVADAVRELGPLRYSDDGQFWAYREGVWRPGDDEVHGRICLVLGERYRPMHARTVRDVLRAELEPIRVAPVPDYLNLRNGLVIWYHPAGPFLAHHDDRVLSTVQLPVEWVPDAVCPEFDRFLTEAVAADDRQRVWEILGYLMMSGNPLQRLFLLTGGGGNGKGVFLSVVEALLGPANVSNVPLQDFADSQFATAEVFGKLANVCGDIDATYIEKTARIKQLAGEDTIKGERKYGQPFYFKFWGKMLFSANETPVASDHSRGWLRRWEIVNFPNEPTTPDDRLRARLTAPGSLQGIAVRAVAALRDVLAPGRDGVPGVARRRFDRGESAAAAHLEFAQRNNKLLAWIADEDLRDPDGWHPRRDLLMAFRAWDKDQNPASGAMGSQTFYERMRQVEGVQEIIRRGVRGFRGLTLPTFDPHGWIADQAARGASQTAPPPTTLWPAET
jgi:P4 family phage/plasmid primase-like protien